DPHLLNLRPTNPLLQAGHWKNYTFDPNRIDLDAVYPKIVEGSWAVLASPTYSEVCRVKRVTSLSASRFAISGKLTRIVPDHFAHSSSFTLDNTTVYAQSEPLELVERPLREPVYGSQVTLEELAPELVPRQPLAITGKSQRIRLTRAAHN